MSEYIQDITLEQARKLAEDSAIREIGSFRESCNILVLSGLYLEAECCWFFFRNMEIRIPDHMSLRDGAYAVSKKGHLRRIADFSDEPIKLKEYLEVLSEYFKKNNE